MRLVAPLVLVAVAVPIVIDLLKPVAEKVKDEVDNWKKKQDQRDTATVSEPEPAPDAPAEPKAPKKSATPKKPASKKSAASSAKPQAGSGKATAAAKKPAPRKKPAPKPAEPEASPEG